jgi:hypothetical protein
VQGKEKAVPFLDSHARRATDMPSPLTSDVDSACLRQGDAKAQRASVGGKKAGQVNHHASAPGLRAWEVGRLGDGRDRYKSSRACTRHVGGGLYVDGTLPVRLSSHLCVHDKSPCQGYIPQPPRPGVLLPAPAPPLMIRLHV